MPSVILLGAFLVPATFLTYLTKRPELRFHVVLGEGVREMRFERMTPSLAPLAVGSPERR